MHISFDNLRLTFPKSDIFTNLDRVLYVGMGGDIEGLEELVEKHKYVVGIDKHICNNPTHFHNKYKNRLERMNKLNVKEMDARKLDFSDGYFDGVIFKRSLAFMGGDRKIKDEEDIRKALNETHRVLCKDGLVWIIYSAADIEELTIDRINVLLESTRFETIEDEEKFRVCKKF